MNYGVCLPLSGIGGDVTRLVEYAHVAEEEGWDGVFLEDYIVYWGGSGVPTYDPWLTLAAIALRTSRVKLGITVTPLSRRRPWKVARESITLDHLSQGRLILGFGLGDEGDSSLTAFGEIIDAKQRAEMLDEGLAVLLGLMSGEAFHFEGKHYQVKDITFLPTPVQRPRAPIWIGGFWPRKAPARRAARWDGFCPAKIPDEHGNGYIQPADIRAIKTYTKLRFITTWPEILSNVLWKSQVVMNLAQQLDSGLQLAYPETSPLPPRLKLYWKLEASLPLRLEEENEETSFVRSYDLLGS